MKSASTSPTTLRTAYTNTSTNTNTPERSPHRHRGRDGLASPAVTNTSHEQTPRVGASTSMRGIPRNADAQALGSPRPAYLARTQSSTAYPVSYPVNPSYSTHGYQSSTMGSVSRSASRARMPVKDLLTVPSTVRQTENDEDDESEVVDRGADLIKRRQMERKQARKKKEKERRKAEGGATPAITPGITPDPSAPPTATGMEGGSSQQDRIAIGRSASRSRTASSAHQDGNESYFSSSWSSSVTPHGPLSPRDGFGPASIYSSAADDDEEDEEEARNSIVNEVIHDVVEEVENEDEDDDEDNGDNGDDEGVTLKDRQDVSQKSMLVLTIGNQYRTSIRSTYLETRTVPQIAYSRPKCRVRTPCRTVRCCRKALFTRQHHVDCTVWLVARNYLLCGCIARQRSRSPRRWKRRVRQDPSWSGLVHWMAIWKVY
jgi:hypothetical protein